MIYYVPVRHIVTSCGKFKEVLRNLKGKKTSSQEWLKRQFSDPYIEKARMANYRYIVIMLCYCNGYDPY